MKLSKQALIAAAVTGVLPGVASAATLGQNLVLNPSFESIGADPGNPAADWGGNLSTYAYSLNYTGPAPAGAGARYWFGGGADPLASQVFDLAGNITAIDGGRIGYNLSAFFSTYLDQKDYGTIRLLFLDSSGSTIGLASIGGATFVGNLPLVDNGVYPNAHSWGQDASAGLVPIGTRSVRMELDGDKDPTVGSTCDSYIDLVNFQIVAVPEPGTVSLGVLGLGMAGWWTIRRRSRR